MHQQNSANFVDWHVYERDQNTIEKKFDQLVSRLDRLTEAIECVVREDRKNRTALHAEWIRLLSAFVAGSVPAIVVAFLTQN